MIELSTDNALLFYLGFTLSILFGLWCYRHSTTRNRRLSLMAQKLLVCEYCHTAYLADVGKSVSRCPCCQSYNRL